MLFSWFAGRPTVVEAELEAEDVDLVVVVVAEVAPVWPFLTEATDVVVGEAACEVNGGASVPVEESSVETGKLVAGSL